MARIEDAQELERTLHRIDGRGYKAYRDIRGRYAFERFELEMGYVQGDPFASPSKIELRVPAEQAGLPGWCFESPARRVALRDWLARRASRLAGELGARRGSGKSGMIDVDGPGQQVLARSAVILDGQDLIARVRVGLPAKGRRVKGHQAARMLCEDIPALVERGLRYEPDWEEPLRAHLACVEDSRWLREQLAEAGLIAFVPDGAALPRRSGVDDRPMASDRVTPFVSPPQLRASFELPNAGPVEGMGIPRGVTLIVGGGYHGKSTVLEALARGVYDHAPGDGRELVVTDPGALKVRAEDGRRVAGVDISPFIGELPGGRSTHDFSSEDASGSTSQAAAIVEALEAGAITLLMDEDTCATNFMIRDERMQRLIASADEPITPFIDRVRDLYEQLGVSTVLVIGGAGDYFDVADRVLAMRDYAASDVTERAHAIAAEVATGRRNEACAPLEPPTPRAPVAGSIDPSRGRRAVKVRVHTRARVSFGEEELELGGLGQLVEHSQVRAVALALAQLGRQADGQTPLAELMAHLMRQLEREGLDDLAPYAWDRLAMFRPLELAGALNRLRSLRVRQ